jgi:hypothetical protein
MKSAFLSALLALPFAIADEVVVDFWVKAFIPLHVEGVTETYPKDSSMSMLQGLPFIGDCFLTDHRSFGSASGASARMHSETWIWIKPDGYSWDQAHRCGETIEVDCEDGDEEGKETAGTEDMSFTEKEGSSSRVVLDFKAAGANPLVFAAPNIDLEGTLTLDRVNQYIEFVGKVDNFPAFEAYVSINGSAPRTIAQLGPEDGAGPSSLIGGANREFRGRIDF